MEDNPMFRKLIEKKKKEGKIASPIEKKAKGSVLADLMSELGGMGLEKLKGLKKVTVAADSKPGLEEGLAKAKEMLGEHAEEGSDEEESHESPEEEAMEEASDESSDDESHDEVESPEEIKAKIAELQAKLDQIRG